MNRLLIRLLEGRAGRWAGGRLAVVSYTGRRSGKPYRLVTAYARDGEVVRIDVGLAGRKTWWRNFRDGGPVRLVLRGRRYDATARVVEDGDRVRVVAELTT